MGCLVEQFSGEPDVIVFPDFAQRSVAPGSDVEFTMLVDDDTRQVQATLMDAWRLQSANPMGPSETVTQATTGGALQFSIPMPNTGQYYVDLVLCGSDCTSSRVVYTLNRANAGPDSDAINDPYERIVFNGDTEVSSSFTCRHPASVAVQ